MLFIEVLLLHVITIYFDTDNERIKNIKFHLILFDQYIPTPDDQVITNSIHFWNKLLQKLHLFCKLCQEFSKLCVYDD